MLYLILIELAEVLHIHVISLGIHYCGESVEYDPVILKILDCNDNI